MTKQSKKYVIRRHKSIYHWIAVTQKKMQWSTFYPPLMTAIL